jgi:hypothetical protein
MKNRIKYITIWMVICSGFIIGACTDLEDASYTDIVASDFIPSDDDIGALLGTAYVDWRDVYMGGGRAYWTVQEETADALVRARKPYGFYDGGIHQLLHYHTWTSEDGAYGSVWTNAFGGVTTCNRLLFQIESGQIPLEGAVKEAVLSEIRVLRASFYYVLVDVFGNVPILTTYDVPAGFLPEQNTRQEVFDFIVSEITESIPSLRDDHNNETYGRFNNKWSAYALLAKVYLNAEVWSGTPRWEECIAACDAIINSNQGFALEPVQKNVFKEQNQNSTEQVWTIPYDEIFGPGMPLNVITLPHQASQTYNLRATGWGGLVSIPQFIDSYNPDDKRLTDGWLYGQVYSSSGEPLNVNTGTMAGQPMVIVNELPGIDYSEEVHSYRILKYEVPVGSDPINMSNDVPMVRYADILMMKAESLMRLGQPGAGALVTEVRLRNFPDNPALAAVSDAELTATSSYDYGLRDYILGETHETDPIQYGRFLDELGWEFAAEAHRRQDMVRFGVFNRKSRLSYQAFPDGSHDYRDIGPIPLTELNTNPNLHQNPGY